jgi:hypothetical protein
MLMFDIVVQNDPQKWPKSDILTEKPASFQEAMSFSTHLILWRKSAIDAFALGFSGNWFVFLTLLLYENLLLQIVWA